ncbi:homoserine dehydrogenase [Gammaproteobacteria bacterium]|nr:homoserine dehydrogenase [Gammaproteobacteria bacterium]
MNSELAKCIKVGICGFGTVGGGSYNLLQANGEEITRRVGCAIDIVRVASRSISSGDFNSAVNISNDPFDVVNDPEVDIVIETIGGFDPAFEVVRQALVNGKHVVTANKALIAERGNELFTVAQENAVTLAYESSVAGGIPIIKALREGLSANKIDWLAGIINGTANFILTEMADKQRQFADALTEAQQLGYAEADPTFDVEGIDAAHKLTIMASIAFGIPLQFDKTYTEGISRITPQDIGFAKQLGYRVKHLGIARRIDNRVEMRVHPTLIPRKRLLASVDGVGNAVLVHGNAVGSTLYNGPGAGAGATASSVIADVIDIARQKLAGLSEPLLPALGYLSVHDDLEVVSIEEIVTEYYLRIPVNDVVGVLAKISSILQGFDISIEAVIQKELDSKTVPIVILTHKAIEKKLNLAIAAIEALEDVSGEVMRIRVETFEG